MASRETLLEVQRRLEAACDIDGWHWRRETPRDEICIGSILVQHTSWANVEKALARLRDADALSIEAMARLAEEELAALVRPAGMPNQKARRLKAFAALVESRGGDALFSLPTDELRATLLATPGIGKETANALALHAAHRPVFVVDAYTIRLFGRLGLGPGGAHYETWQRWFEERLPRNDELYRRYHAGIVLHCKNTCRARPLCGPCGLLDICPTGRAVVDGRSNAALSSAWDAG